MRKIAAIIVIIIFLVLAAAPCFADFRFVVIGDTRDDSGDGINVKTMKTILDRIKTEKVDFIIVVGDMITGSTKSSTHIHRLKKWKDVIERYGIPFYVGIGNHEIESELSENIVRSIFEMPENGPSDYKELIYSFNYENSHFIMLDTEIFNHFHAIGEAQLKWLKEDLEKNQKKNIFVFGHDPAYPVHGHIGSSLDKYIFQRDELWSVFKKYKVNAYICGHEHLYDRAIYEGVYQIITGGGGAPITIAEEKGGFYNFVIMDIKSDRSVGVTAKDINGFVKDTFDIEY